MSSGSWALPTSRNLAPVVWWQSTLSPPHHQLPGSIGSMTWPCVPDRVDAWIWGPIQNAQRWSWGHRPDLVCMGPGVWGCGGWLNLSCRGWGQEAWSSAWGAGIWAAGPIWHVQVEGRGIWHICHMPILHWIWFADPGVHLEGVQWCYYAPLWLDCTTGASGDLFKPLKQVKILPPFLS